MAERTDTLVSLARAKTLLDLGDDEDTRLAQMIRVASQLVRTTCHRWFLRETFTETRDGPQLRTSVMTQEFPLSSVSSLYDSWDRSYGATHLIDPANYVVYPFGKIQLVNGLAFATGVQNLQFTYEAGFEVLRVVAGVNDRIDFKEAAEGDEKSATLTAGDYTAEELATEVTTRMTAAGAANYTVSYSTSTQKFTIATDGGFLSLLWSTGTNGARTAARLMGFSIVDDTGSTSYLSDSLIVPVPEQLEAGVALWAGRLLELIEPGEEMESETLGDYAYKRGKKEGPPKGVMDLIGDLVRRDRFY